ELAVIVPEVAVMMAVPGGLDMVEAAVTRPPLLTVAMSVAELVQLALPVKSLVLPSLKLPVALICCVPPSMIEAEVGATVIEVSVGLTKNPRQPAARANTNRAAKVAKMRRFRSKWLQRIVAEKVLARANECTSVCTKVCGSCLLPRPFYRAPRHVNRLTF